jgi:hypothetical protein
LETRLVDAEIANIPVNLFDDIANIPYNEVQAVDALSESLLFSGPWTVTSATNIWGIDPGDPGHFLAVTDLLLPFTALSGMGSPEDDWTAGLGQQLWGLIAAEAPVNGACAADGCLPIVPTSPITGLAGIDQGLWWSQILTGQEQFPLINNWFQVPLSDLVNGYTFGTNYPGYVDPSGTVYSLFGLSGTGPGDTMPWDGTTYYLNPSQVFENFFQSLMATPSTDGIAGATGTAIPGTGIELPTLTEVGQSFQALLASLVVAFDPWTPGSPLCVGDCAFVTDQGTDYPQLVQAISNLMPGNPIIDQWLAAYDGGTANVPTADQIQIAIQALQQGAWDFSNPSPPSDWSLGGLDLSTLAPQFEQLWTDLGVPTSTLDSTNAQVEETYNEFWALLGYPSSAASGASVDTMSPLFDPTSAAAAATDQSTALSTDLSTLLGGLDPAGLSADLSSLLANFGATLSADISSSLLSMF